ncbi:MAG: carbohydrate ABC transporter permease, partial [Lachnospiraceae bacterium]|nr:carbohydrate ABC transporter permease [Lachnospiraceae bacterium]
MDGQAKKNNYKREGNRSFHIFNYIFLGMIFLLVAYPIYFVLIASISHASAVGTGQVLLLPKQITIEGYKAVFS